MRVRCEMLSSQRAHLLQLLHGMWTLLAGMAGLEPAVEAAELARLDVMRAEMDAALGALQEAVATNR